MSFLPKDKEIRIYYILTALLVIFLILPIVFNVHDFEIACSRWSGHCGSLDMVPFFAISFFLALFSITFWIFNRKK